MTDLVVFVFGFAVLVLTTVVTIRISYGLGYQDGYRKGLREGAQYGQLKALEQKRNDYGSYDAS